MFKWLIALSLYFEGQSNNFSKYQINIVTHIKQECVIKNEHSYFSSFSYFQSPKHMFNSMDKKIIIKKTPTISVSGPLLK